MASQATLDGLRVLVTRPAEQAEPLSRLLERNGAQVTRLPMQVIEPVRQAAAAAAQLQQHRDARAWIFTSVNAVRHARTLDAGVWPPCIAVGPATAAALQQAGIEDVTTPAQQHDSEAVLALDELQDVRDRSVVIVTGEGGRDTLETGLDARGANVMRIEVYRRVALPHTPEALAAACVDVDAVVFTNGESLRLMFSRIADEARLPLLALQLVVPSQRVVEQALELGFRTAPLVPEQTGDAGCLRVLEQWWQTRDRAPRMTEQDQKQEPAAAPAGADAAPGADPQPAHVDRVADAERAASASATTRRGGAAWVLLAFVVVLALLAAVGWEAYRRLDAMLAERDARIERLQAGLEASNAQVERLQTRGGDQAVAVQRNAAELARFADRLDAQDQAIGLLREELGGGRIRVQLAVVEQLLMLANDRLQVGREVAAAVTALEAADSRLAVLADPRLFAVREAIARERAALQAVPRADASGAALSLASLIERAPLFALKAQVPDSFRPEPSANADTEVATMSRTQRAWAAIKRAVASAFTIRREGGPPPQLLSAEQDALIRQVLALKLEGARAALLRRDATTFRELCRSASAWLGDYFSDNDVAISAAQAELTRLQDLQLDPPLPDISGSLVLLRAGLEPAPQ